MSLEAETPLTSQQLQREFNRKFFEETGIVLRDRTRNYVRGTLGWGDDSGIGPQHILHAVRCIPDLRYSVSATLWDESVSKQELARLLISLDNGSAFLYTDNSGNEDVMSIIGDVHVVRSLGKEINNRISPKNTVKKFESLYESSMFTWIRVKTPYDSFSPNEISSCLSKLAKNHHSVISNPSLNSFTGNDLIFKLLASIDDNCFVVGKIDSVDIIGWNTEAKTVANEIHKVISKKHGLMFEMTNTSERSYLFEPKKINL